MLPFSRTHCARLKNSDMTRRGIHLSVTCTYSTVPNINNNFKETNFHKKNKFSFSFFESCHTQQYSKLTNETSKKIEFWNNFSRELRKKKKRENITHQQQKQQISVEISISFPSTQIALHKRKAEIKCLFLIVSLCFLLHFFASQRICFCGCHYFALRLLSSLLMDMLFVFDVSETDVILIFLHSQHINVHMLFGISKFKGHSPIRVWNFFPSAFLLFFFDHWWLKILKFSAFFLWLFVIHLLKNYYFVI